MRLQIVLLQRGTLHRDDFVTRHEAVRGVEANRIVGLLDECLLEFEFAIGGAGGNIGSYHGRVSLVAPES